MHKRLALFLIVLLLALSGCSAARSTSEEAPAGAPAPAPAMEPAFGEADMGRDAYDYDTPQEQSAGGGVSSAQIERLVIRNATLSVVVAEPGDSMSAIARMAEEMGGYVVSSNLYKSFKNDREYPEATINVRVPAEQLNNAMDQIKGLVEDPDNDILVDNVVGQDVTDDYTDARSRLRNLEETEAQLREIMASATRTEDVLAVHNQLTQIREQIEVTKGRIQYFEESAALSSISVTLVAKESVQPLEIGGWQPVGTARDAVQALIDALKVLGNITIWLLLFALPVGLVIFLPLRLLWGLFRRTRRPAKNQASAPPPPAAS